MSLLRSSRCIRRTSEFERTFRLTPAGCRNVAELLPSMKVHRIHDTYFDISEDYPLLLNDYWLRLRNGVWELKYPLQSFDPNAAPSYIEVTGADDVASTILLLGERVSLGTIPASSVDVLTAFLTDAALSSSSPPPLQQVCTIVSQRGSVTVARGDGGGRVSIDIDWTRGITSGGTDDDPTVTTAADSTADRPDAHVRSGHGPSIVSMSEVSQTEAVMGVFDTVGVLSTLCENSPRPRSPEAVSPAVAAWWAVVTRTVCGTVSTGHTRIRPPHYDTLPAKLRTLGSWDDRVVVEVEVAVSEGDHTAVTALGTPSVCTLLKECETFVACGASSEAERIALSIIGDVSRQFGLEAISKGAGKVLGALLAQSPEVCQMLLTKTKWGTFI